MKPNEADNGAIDWNRRDFLRGTSFGTLMTMLGGVPLEAQQATNAPAGSEDTHYDTRPSPISCAVIGCGVWGREILQTLPVAKTKTPPPIVAICDSYESA